MTNTSAEGESPISPSLRSDTGCDWRPWETGGILQPPPPTPLLDPCGHVGRLTPLCSPPLQVTLSYGMFENKRNSIHMKGAFSVEEDPSR